MARAQAPRQRAKFSATLSPQCAQHIALTQAQKTAVKKSTLVRSDKPHAVKMAEGTNVAQRKNPKKTNDSNVSTEPAPNFQKLPPVDAARPEPIAFPAAATKPVRAKATQPKAPAAPRATAKAQPETQAQAIWQQDNPIKRRIDDLKARNAQLAEQIQQVQTFSTARGQ